MGVRNVLPIVPDGGAESRATHVECRDCGANLPSDAEQCPDCGGGIAVYEL